LVCINTIKTEAINETANVSIYSPTKKLGIYCGPTLNRLVGDQSSEQNARLYGDGFHMYSFYTCFLKPYLDLELTFGYHLKSLELGEAFDSCAENADFHYLQLTPQLHILPGDDRQFFIVLGAYGGYLMAAKAQGRSYSNRNSSPKKHHSKRHHSKRHQPRDMKESPLLNHWDAGIVVGFGYQFEIGLILKFNANVGLRNLFDTPDGIQNRFISNDYSLGYNFGKLFE